MVCAQHIDSSPRVLSWLVGYRCLAPKPNGLFSFPKSQSLGSKPIKFRGGVYMGDWVAVQEIQTKNKMAQPFSPRRFQPGRVSGRAGSLMRKKEEKP